MIVVPFIPAHTEGMVVHEWMMSNMDQSRLEELSIYPSYTAIVDGEAIAAIGVYPAGDCYTAWGLMTPKTARHMLPITRGIQDFLRLFEAKSIGAYVRSDFKAGLRWMRLLGFRHESSMMGEDGHKYYQFIFRRNR